MKHVVGFFVVVAFALGAFACETVVTHAEVAADRVRAVEFFGASNAAGAQLGKTVNAVGDVNGDGFDDFALAAPNENADQGSVYVVFGRSAEAWASAQFDFNATDTPDPASWIRISGENGLLYFGSHGIAHDDFNGDGLEDILIGAFSPAAFCVFGRRGNWSSFSTADIGGIATPGFSVLSESFSNKYVGVAGDMNGDGIADLLVTDYDGYHPSTVFVVFGTSGSRGEVSLSSINGTNGFSFSDGMLSLGVGGKMGKAGDIDGDGLDDLAIGSSGAGRLYVLFARNVSAPGQTQWDKTLNLSSFIDGTNGFIVEDSAQNSYLGWTVAGAGDVNGDGFADIFTGSFSTAGAWLVFGHPAPWTSPLNASQLNGANGFRFAQFSSEFWGHSGGGAGDVNGDGFDDIVIGGYSAHGSTGEMTGVACILLGHGGVWPAELAREDAVGSAGFTIDGPAVGSYFGYSARGAGDVNGDGISDFVVGANKLGTSFGYALLVFGTPDDHCAVCSNASDACFVCEDGFFLNGTICEFNQTTSSSSVQQGVSVVVIIHFIEDVTDPTELEEEIASALGIDAGLVSVVVINPTEVEVTIIGSEETAQRLVDIINNGGAGSDGSGLGLLRKAIDAHIRKDTDGDGSSDDDGVEAAPRVAHTVLEMFLLFLLQFAWLCC